MTLKNWTDGDILYSADLESSIYTSAMIEDLKTKLMLHKKTGYDAWSENCFIDGLYDQTRSNATSNLTYDSASDFYYSMSATASYESKTQLSSSDKIIVPFFNYQILDLYDDFGDSSIDTTIWTTATATGGGTASGAVTEEAGGYLQVYIAGDGSHTASASAITKGSSNFDFNDLTNNLIYLYIDFEIGAGNQSMILRLTDDTHTVTLYDNSTSATSRTKHIYVIDKEKLLVTRLGTINSTNISSLTDGNIRLEFYASEGGTNVGNRTMKVYDVYYTPDSPASTISLQAAPDASTYETVTNGAINSLTTAGTSKRAKISFTQSGSEMFILDGIGFFVNK